MKSNKSTIRTLIVLASASVLAATAGCVVAAVGAAGAAGAGTVAFIRGELEATVSSSFETVIPAASKAVGQLGFSKIRETKDALAAEIVARTALDKKVDIKLNKETDQLTRVSIRIGIFGDEVKSRAILDQIKQNL
jgi:hypothetical protein